MPAPRGEVVATAFLDALMRATTSERASTVLLREVLAISREAIARSPFAGPDVLQRATIHIRPADAYRSLAVMEAGADELSTTTDDKGRSLFSSTAWRWLRSRRRAIWFDVNLALVHLNDEGEPATVTDRGLAGSEFSNAKSRAHLLGREVSHVLMVPLRGPGSEVEGMLSVEARCRAAMGQPFVWPDCANAIQTLADVAAPYVLGLPGEPSAPPATDEHLPVVGRSMARTVELLNVFVQQDEPLLIGGPTGTGKSRLARWCHAHSARRQAPFEALDLSAVPEELQLAELFGWRRGAFTGAVRDNEGLIARAHGGTLFIDEIANLSARSQAGLLHVLEERTYRTLGDGGAEKEAQVRFIIGTNENLQDAVREKRFREDLYYRINVLPISLPALRQRADEIPLWSAYMVNRHHAKSGGAGTAGIAPAAQALLQREPWPGNLRQLDNIVRRAYAVALLGREAGAEPLVLSEDHVKRAIAYETPGRGDNSVDGLLNAAAAFVNYVCARGDATPVDLDLLDGFKGLVLGGALERLGGDLDEVFRLFGREKLVAGRNHHKAFRRELERAAQLHSFMDPRSPFPFAGLLDGSMRAEKPSERRGPRR